MPWTEKIKMGMKLIKEGCEQNEIWLNCKYCPLENICDQLIDGARANDEDWDDALLPCKWELVD